LERSIRFTNKAIVIKMNRKLTDSLGVVTFEPEVAFIAVALPGLVAAAVLAVPVGHALGAVGAGPTVAADAGVRHHAEALKDDKRYLMLIIL
jgi:hypothetical protein